MAGSAQASDPSPAMVEPQLREQLGTGEPVDFWVYLVTGRSVGDGTGHDYATAAYDTQE